MKKFIFVLSLVLLCFSVFQSCKHRTEPLPPVAINPCDTAKIPTANFKIYEAVDTDMMFENWGERWQNIDTDTIIVNSGVYFVANETGAKYKWRLGSETITSKNFYRENFPANTLINVSLETTKKHSLWGQCFPTTDTVFSKSRNFYVLDDWNKSKVWGNYSGTFSQNPNQTKTLGIGTEILYVSPLIEQLRIKLSGIETQSACVNVLARQYNVTYKQIHFAYHDNLSPCSFYLAGIARIHGVNNDSITVNYQIYPTANLNVPIHTFKGKRIQ